MWYEPQEGRPMNSAKSIIEKAILEDGGVDIYLSVDLEMDGMVPVHIEFTKFKHNPMLSQTKHHPDAEVELVVDNSQRKKFVWLKDNPSLKAKVRGINEVGGRYVSPRRLNYAFLDVTNVYKVYDTSVF